MHTVTICGGNLNHVRALTDAVSGYFNQKQVPHEALEYIDPQSVVASLKAGGRSDIYILDISPAMDGIALARYIRGTDNTCSIILLSDSADSAMKGYTVKVQDYLVKPIKKERLFTSLDHALERISRTGSHIIRIKNSAGHREIRSDTIMYAESSGHTLTLALSDGSYEKVTDTFERYAPMLLWYRFFMQCHRSYLVNLNYVRELQDNDFILYNDSRIPIARGRMLECRNDYYDFIRDKNADYLA